MTTEKREVGGHDFWFTIDRTASPDPDTGELIEGDDYYVAFSTREPSDALPGEIIKNARGCARLFPSPGAALDAGVEEVAARLAVPGVVFAVDLPGGTSRADYAAYERVLKESGIDPGAGPRVEDSFGRKWLHVWVTRDEAERFADRLRRDTRSRAWEVYELRPLRPDVDGTDGTSGPLVILVGRQSDGYVYALHPRSLKRLRQRFPGVRAVETLSVGRGNGAPDLTYDQVAQHLTRLAPGTLAAEFGGYRVVDPVSDLTLWETAAEPSGAHPLAAAP